MGNTTTGHGQQKSLDQNEWKEQMLPGKEKYEQDQKQHSDYVRSSHFQRN